MSANCSLSYERYLTYVLFNKREETWYSFPRYYVELDKDMKPIALYATMSLDDDAKFNDWVLYERRIMQHVHQEYFAQVCLRTEAPIIIMRY